MEEKGHIQALKNTVDELTELHFFLLHQAHDGRYRQLVTQAAGNLVEFRRKAGVDDTVSDVELALNGLYGQLMLKLQKREIHPETVAAMESFSKMIAYLAARYKQMEEEAEKIQNFNLIEYESANCSVVACWLREFNRKPKPVRKNMKKLILKPGSKSWCCPTNMEKWKLFRWMEMRSK